MVVATWLRVNWAKQQELELCGYLARSLSIFSADY